jgi:uncharacterized membrane protein
MYNENYKEPNVVYMDLVKAASGAVKPFVQPTSIVLSVDDFTQLLAHVENMTREIQKLTKEFDAVTKAGKAMIEQQTLMQYPKLYSTEGIVSNKIQSGLTANVSNPYLTYTHQEPFKT